MKKLMFGMLLLTACATKQPKTMAQLCDGMAAECYGDPQDSIKECDEDTQCWHSLDGDVYGQAKDGLVP